MSAHPSPARFSLPLTMLYLVAVLGFVLGAFLWTGKDEQAGPDGPLDLADFVLMASWAVLVVAAALTARRRWATPKS